MPATEEKRSKEEDMNTSLRNRVALVTGAGRGIGRAVALALAGAGADVAVNYRRDEAAAAETVAAIRALGRRAQAYRASVENWDEDAAMVDAVVRDFGSLGILVNNAGIGSRGHSVAETDIAELERVVRVHAFGPFYLCKLAIPQLRRQPRGDIVMVSSIITRDITPNGAPYCMGKSAMEALGYTLAREERQHGIRTHVVAPSLTDTDMGRRLVAASGIQDIHQLDPKRPFGRVSVPEDVAATIAFLVSDANAYINGQRIAIDGGG